MKIVSEWFMNVGDSMPVEKSQPPVPKSNPLSRLVICYLVTDRGDIVAGESMILGDFTPANIADARMDAQDQAMGVFIKIVADLEGEEAQEQVEAQSIEQDAPVAKGDSA